MPRIPLLISLVCITVLLAGCTGGGGTGTQPGGNATHVTPGPAGGTPAHAGNATPEAGVSGEGAAAQPQPQQLQDSPACSDVTSADWKNVCNAATLLNSAYCPSVTDPLTRAACYHWLAPKVKDASLCDNIAVASSEAGAFVGGIVVSNCKEQVGIATGDYSLCGSDKQCIMSIAAAKGDSEKCETIDDLNKGVCYQRVAVAQNDSSLCEKAARPSSSTGVAECYAAVAIVSKNVNSCSKAGGIYTPDMCRAAVTGDASICASMEAWDQDTCYSITATMNQDSKTCARISDALTKESCYYTVAIAKGEVSACYQTESSDQTKCLAIASHNPSICDDATDKDPCYEVCLHELLGVSSDVRFH